jgi:hypothetical protein
VVRLVTAGCVYLQKVVYLVTVEGTLMKTGGTSGYSRLCVFTKGGIFNCKRWYVLSQEIACLFITRGKLNYSKWYVAVQQLVPLFTTDFRHSYEKWHVIYNKRYVQLQ